MISSASRAQTFQIGVQPSGRVFACAPGETLLAAAIRQGVGLPYGCRDGACGTCKCKKLAGVVRHGPHQSKALSALEESQGMVLTCCGVAYSDVSLESKQVTQAGAWAIRRMPVRVSLIESKAPDVMLLHLQLPANEAFAYHAGQYLEILLRDGARRSYSMANAAQPMAAGALTGPVGATLELHIRHLPGGKFTDQVFGSMKAKDILRIEGPFGSFYLREDSDKPIILLASGTGFAPVKAIIERLQSQAIERPATLYWGARRPLDLYLDSWVKDKLAEMPSLRYVPVISDALPADDWRGRSGFVHQAVLQDVPDLSAYQVYASGAPIMVESARADYLQAGLPADEFYADAFITEAHKASAVSPALDCGAGRQ